MASPPRRSFEPPRALSALAQTFWLLALAVIVLFAFFLALGTFSIGEVGWIAVLVGVLTVLWLVHAALQRRRSNRQLDPALIHARERRGF